MSDIPDHCIAEHQTRLLSVNDHCEINSDDTTDSPPPLSSPSDTEDDLPDLISPSASEYDLLVQQSLANDYYAIRSIQRTEEHINDLITSYTNVASDHGQPVTLTDLNPMPSPTLTDLNAMRSPSPAYQLPPMLLDRNAEDTARDRLPSVAALVYPANPSPNVAIPRIHPFAVTTTHTELASLLLRRTAEATSTTIVLRPTVDVQPLGPPLISVHVSCETSPDAAFDGTQSFWQLVADDLSYSYVAMLSGAMERALHRVAIGNA